MMELATYLRRARGEQGQGWKVGEEAARQEPEGEASREEEEEGEIAPSVSGLRTLRRSGL
jgi:hypothetical protein